MGANDGNDGNGGEDLDLSMRGVTARLSAFVAEHKAALAKGDSRASSESERRLAAWSEEALERQEQALKRQEEAERKLAEAVAKVELIEFEQAGGRLQ
jgi:hypothetical protein